MGKWVGHSVLDTRFLARVFLASRPLRNLWALEVWHRSVAALLSIWTPLRWAQNCKWTHLLPFCLMQSAFIMLLHHWNKIPKTCLQYLAGLHIYPSFLRTAYDKARTTALCSFPLEHLFKYHNAAQECAGSAALLPSVCAKADPLDNSTSAAISILHATFGDIFSEFFWKILVMIRIICLKSTVNL